MAFDQNQTEEVDKVLNTVVKSFDSEALEYIKTSVEENFHTFFGESLELRLVLDTSAFIPELISYVRKKESFLFKLTESPFLKLYSPSWLNEELERKIPVIAKKMKLNEEELKETASFFLEKITILEIEEEEKLREAYEKIGHRDPKDAPFVGMYLSIRSHGILTRDKDFTELSEIKVWERPGEVGKVVTVFEKGAFSFLLLGVGLPTAANLLYDTMVVLLGIFIKVFSSLANGITAFATNSAISISKMPNWLKISIGIAVILLILWDKSRKVICDTSKDVFNVLSGSVRNFMEEFYNPTKEILDVLVPIIEVSATASVVLLESMEELIETYKEMENNNN